MIQIGGGAQQSSFAKNTNVLLRVGIAYRGVETDSEYFVAHLSAEGAFGETEALDLGARLVGLAKARGAGVVINIRTPDRTLFHAALPGSAQHGHG